MHKYFIVSLWILFITIPCEIYSQTFNTTSPTLPLKELDEIMFGKDIIVHADTSTNQTHIAICSAYNGWLFAAISSLTTQGLRNAILISTDNGLTWSVKMDVLSTFYNTVIKRVSLATSGNSIDNLKLFLGLIYNDTTYNTSAAWVGRYNVEPFQGEEEILSDYDRCYDIAMASDYSYPAAGSSPGSIAVLYSKKGIKDTIVCRTSSNGGMTLNSRNVVGITTNHFDKVALNYGRSLSWAGGKYYAAWEEKEYSYSDFGHIYTAHSGPNFNSSFSNPVCLDSLNGAWINQCRNPILACQYGDTDNDSANITELVLFESLNIGNNSLDVEGCYNLQSTISSQFHPFSLSSTADDEIQPFICYNPLDSIFMGTYANQTTQMLPFMTNSMNLENPNQWIVTSEGYNDNPMGTDPQPQITYNPIEASGANVWISKTPEGKGSGLFDAVYSNYTGNVDLLPIRSFPNILVYPNPCTSTLTIRFELNKVESVNFAIYDLLGQPVSSFYNEVFSCGIHQHTLNISGLPVGIYFILLKSNSFQTCTKIHIIR